MNIKMQRRIGNISNGERNKNVWKKICFDKAKM